MVVPVDAEKDEAQNIRQEERQDRPERVEIRALRDFQLENHDRDDDRDHAVAERFQPPLGHLVRSIIVGRREEIETWR